jgi:hypothetical protein
MSKVDPANILVLVMVVGFLSFVIYFAVRSRIEERKSKKEQAAKE